MTQMELAEKADAALAKGGETSALLRLAVEKSLDVDKLERLVALHERGQAKQAQREFFDALAAFQAEMPAITRKRVVRRDNGALLYKFANADDITKAIRENEQKHGFSHRFDTQTNDKGACIVTCIITHNGGHSERATMTVAPTKGNNTNPAQDNGIQIQYGMRYSLCMAYGITTAAEDTDGRDGEQGEKADKLTAADRQALGALAKELKLTKEDVCRMAGVDDTIHILKADLSKLQEKMRKNGNA